MQRGVKRNSATLKGKVQMLREREEQLRSLVENVPGVLQRFDRQQIYT